MDCHIDNRQDHDDGRPSWDATDGGRRRFAEHLAASYRAALVASGHPAITLDRIDRLVEQVNWTDMHNGAQCDNECGWCGSICGGWWHWKDEDPQSPDATESLADLLLCSCGTLRSLANYYRADLCASCGADPRKCEPPLCGRCGKPEPRWRDGRYHTDGLTAEEIAANKGFSSVGMLVSGEMPCDACQILETGASPFLAEWRGPNPSIKFRHVLPLL